VKAIACESQPATVSERAKQAGEAAPGWEWVERTVWTDRMLEALDKGVKGGVWFSLIDISRGHDNRRWPNEYFRELGYFSLYDAHRALLQSS
jgi:hypothetical protein